MLDALAASGVDAVTMADNHGLDFGPVGLAESLVAIEAVDPCDGSLSDRHRGNASQAWQAFVAEANRQIMGVLTASDVLEDLAWAAVDVADVRPFTVPSGPACRGSGPGQGEHRHPAGLERHATVR